MFQVIPLSSDAFSSLYGLSDTELALRGVHVEIAASDSGYPCRVSLEQAGKGRRVLLLNYEHQPADSPFRSCHAIYVRDGADTANVAVNELPPVIRDAAMLSVRAFSQDGMMQSARLVEGLHCAPVFEDLLARDDVAYLHAHLAAYGCFAAKIVRA